MSGFRQSSKGFEGQGCPDEANVHGYRKYGVDYCPRHSPRYYLSHSLLKELRFFYFFRLHGQCLSWSWWISGC